MSEITIEETSDTRMEDLGEIGLQTIDIFEEVIKEIVSYERRGVDAGDTDHTIIDRLSTVIVGKRWPLGQKLPEGFYEKYVEPFEKKSTV